MGLIWQSSMQKGSGLIRMNLCSLLQKQSFMEEMLCCAYGRILVVVFILNFLKPPQSDTQCRLILSTAATCAWESENIKRFSIGETCFSMIIQGHIQAGLFSPIHHIHLTYQVISIFIFLSKMLWITKIFLED